MSKPSEPVILQTIFTTVFARGGTPEVDIIRPHNSALVAVPCTSGILNEELSIGDAGWQFFRPGAVGPVIVVLIIHYIPEIDLKQKCAVHHILRFFYDI